jgi:hypothetical protein
MTTREGRSRACGTAGAGTRKPARSSSFFRALVLGAVAAAGPGIAAGCVMAYGTPDYGIPPEDVVDAAEDATAEDGGTEDAATAEDGAAVDSPEGTWDYGVPDGS